MGMPVSVLQLHGAAVVHHEYKSTRWFIIQPWGWNGIRDSRASVAATMWIHLVVAQSSCSAFQHKSIFISSLRCRSTGLQALGVQYKQAATPSGVCLHNKVEPLEEKIVNLLKWEGLLVLLSWPIRSFGACHWLKGGCQSNPPEAVSLWRPQCVSGGGGEQSYSVETIMFLQEQRSSAETKVGIPQCRNTALQEK